jgi:hypothetical protein
LEWRKLLLSQLEWLGVEEICLGLPGLEIVGYGLTGLAWNSGRQFLPEGTVKKPQNRATNQNYKSKKSTKRTRKTEN